MADRINERAAFAQNAGKTERASDTIGGQRSTLGGILGAAAEKIAQQRSGMHHDDYERLQSLIRTKNVITGQRHLIDTLRPQAEAYRHMTQLLDLVGRNGNGAYAVDREYDILWQLERDIEILQMRAEREKRDAEQGIGPENGDRYSAEREPESDVLGRVEETLDAGTELDRIRESMGKVVPVAVDPGNAFANDYLHGMANGLILAQSIVDGTEPAFLEMPKPEPEPAEKFQSTAGQDLAGAGLDLGPIDYLTPGDRPLPPVERPLSAVVDEYFGTDSEGRPSD